MTTDGTARRIWIAGALACAATLALGAGQAFAATNVTLNGGPSTSSMTVIDATNDADVITISLTDNTISVTDTGTGGIATADADCAAAGNTVTCPHDPPDPAIGPVTFISIQPGNGEDSVNTQALPRTIDNSVDAFGTTGTKTISFGPGDDGANTGTGNDVVDFGDGFNGGSGGDGNDTFTGGPRGDFMSGSLGNDILSGNGGDDSFSEDGFNNGADTMDGGPGRDSVGYGGVLPVALSANGQADDGHDGEGDLLAGVEDFFTGDGNDTLVGDGADNDLSSGQGDDTLSGGGGADDLDGGLGNDSIDGGDGNDSADGGDEGEMGADVLNGGPGSDMLDYFGSEPVSVNQNGVADDGRQGEGDNVSGFEGLDGGDGNDTLIGDDSNNDLFGDSGDDRLVGNGGSDVLDGFDGDDILMSVGGPDEVDCGLGFDTSVHDADDEIGSDCERRGADVVSDSSAANKKGKAKVQLECPDGGTAACEGKLVFLSNGKTVAKGNFDVDAGETGKARAKLTKKGRKTLAKANNELLVSAEARTETPEGTTTNAERLELEAKKKKKGGGKGGGKG